MLWPPCMYTQQVEPLKLDNRSLDIYLRPASPCFHLSAYSPAVYGVCVYSNGL